MRIQSTNISPKLVSILFISLLITACTKQDIKNTLKKEGLKGKVKSVTYNAYDAINKLGEIEKEKLTNKYYKNYNTRGNITEKTFYNEDGSKGYSEVFTYDSKGKLNSRITYNGDVLSDKIIIKTDEKSNKLEKIWYDSNGQLIGKWINQLDNKDNITDEIYYNADGSLDYKLIISYDSLGKTTEDHVYNTNGMLKSHTTYKYDDNSNLIDVCRFEIDGKPSHKETYKYDSKGNIIEKIDDLIFVTVISKYKYDEMGKLIEQNDFENDHTNIFKLKATKTFEYDKNGNKIKEITIPIRNEALSSAFPGIPKERCFIIEWEIEYY